MKRLFILLAATATLSASAATLRVNNAAHTAAQFSNVADALEAAQDGDVIFLEPSSKSYGSFDVKKRVTIKGGGYMLDVNNISLEGASASEVDEIKIYVPAVVITGLKARYVTLGADADNVVITRNWINRIELGGTFGYDITDDNTVSGTIIHQNYVYDISGPQYGDHPTATQITNNIIPHTYGSGNGISRLRNAVIRYNTYGTDDARAYSRITNSIFEYNMGGKPDDVDFGEGNTFNNNHSGANGELYGGQGGFKPDSKYAEVDPTISTEHGAFAGETPYVLSGVPAGPVIIDLTLPTAVEKGEDLKVTVKIGTQK